MPSSLDYIKILVARLYRDDRGSVLATEYLALLAIVALGSTAGLQALRDSAVEEMREYGQSIRQVRSLHSGQNASPKRQTQSLSQPEHLAPNGSATLIP